MNNSKALWIIPTEFFVGDSLYIDMMNNVQSLPTVLPMDFSNGIISLVKSSHYRFFALF
jgi:hypothetical protein